MPCNDEVNVNRFTLKTINYAYDPNNNQFRGVEESGRNWTKRIIRTMHSNTGMPKTTTGGNWLINHPLPRETLYSGTQR